MVPTPSIHLCKEVELRLFQWTKLLFTAKQGEKMVLICPKIKTSLPWQSIAHGTAVSHPFSHNPHIQYTCSHSRLLPEVRWRQGYGTECVERRIVTRGNRQWKRKRWCQGSTGFPVRHCYPSPWLTHKGEERGREKEGRRDGLKNTWVRWIDLDTGKTQCVKSRYRKIKEKRKGGDVDCRENQLLRSGADTFTQPSFPFPPIISTSSSRSGSRN